MSLETARIYWKDGAIPDALREALAAYDASPGVPEKLFLARIWRDTPDLLTADRVDLLIGLLTQPEIGPAAVSGAGWRHLLRSNVLTAGAEDMARRLEANALALTLLHEDIVARVDAELALTAVRRWLLLTGQGEDFPRLRAALIAQAVLNGGAWPFDETERTRLADAGDFAAAYLPPPQQRSAARAIVDPVTRAVAEQYEAWPYPSWTRILHGTPQPLAARLREYDPQGPDTIGDPAEVLIAGCGTGQQVARWAQCSPRDHFTAIDLSQASLRWAAERCAALGIGNVTFRMLDLNEVATLGRRFDVVMCTGVLHHLPDPEAGWAALTGVLEPGGIMHIMVYSRVARMMNDAIRAMVGPIPNDAMSDDTLREIRRRVLANPQARRLMQGRDFHSLAGTHDLLAHRHEDPFDLPRIRRGLDTLGLSLIRFELPRQAHRARYLREHPQDPLQRDFAAWMRMERNDPGLFVGMYDFWCRKHL